MCSSIEIRAWPWDSPAVVQRSMRVLSHGLANPVPTWPPQYILPPPQRGCAHAITTVAASNIAGPCGLSFCPLHADHISVRRDAQPLAATTPINPATCPTSIPKGQASLMSPPPTPARTSPSTRYSPGHHSPLQLATASESTADGRVNQSGNRRCRISHQDKVAAHKP